MNEAIHKKGAADEAAQAEVRQLIQNIKDGVVTPRPIRVVPAVDMGNLEASIIVDQPNPENLHAGWDPGHYNWIPSLDETSSRVDATSQENEEAEARHGHDVKRIGELEDGPSEEKNKLTAHSIRVKTEQTLAT